MTVAAVTPRGVREGQRDALEGLVARRGPAVLAYCTEVCSPDVAPRAAAEAFARFRAAVHEAPDLASVDPESLLVSATRHSAASVARLAPPHKRRLAGKSETCALVPMLLAARAAGALGPADRERLGRHLQRCDGCREVEAAFLRAERSYRHPPKGDLARATSGLLVAALTAAAPVGPLTDDAEPDVVDDALERPGDTAERAALAAAAAEPEFFPEPEPEHESESEAGADEDVDEPDDEDEPELDEHPTGLSALPQAAKVEADHSKVSPVPHRRPQVPALPRLPAIPTRVALPVAVVLAATLVVMAAAGVFSGSDPTPPQTNPDAASRRPEEPVTTPLPVKVKKPTPKPKPTTPDDATAPGDVPAANPAPSSAGTGSGTAAPSATPDTGDEGASRTPDTTGGTPSGAAEPDEAPIFEETQTTTTP